MRKEFPGIMRGVFLGGKMQKKMTCESCSWFVEETETIGDYSHEEAVKRQHGFCLVQDLFTNVEPDDKPCEDFCEEKNEDKK